MFLAKVYVYLKKSVSDPQGQTVKHALDSLEYKGVDDVRIGKYFEVKLSEQNNSADAEAQLREMCDKLLVNTVIEDYHFDLIEQ